jgi:carbamoyl-phosphate synthase large subunit
VQFAYEPASRELVVIEMNPRVSRSSALASKATGFPIAKIAALLAVGYTLDELPNDITGKTTAAFEPALDYVAVKAPRFDFAKFGITDPRLGTEMRAVGESLGLGRTFAEAFLKALDGREQVPVELDLSRRGEPVPERWDLLLESARGDLDLPGVHSYFADELRAIAAAERELATTGDIAEAKRFGLTDAIVALVLDVDEEEVRRRRARPGRLAVDSCAAEFEAKTPYFYLSYEDSDPVPVRSRPAIVILGSGPNRIGQGIEFDYCCSRAAGAFRRLGYETVLLNSNPETVSTDYDTSDRLYLEPLTLERTLDVCELEQPAGVVVQLGGQTPLALAPGVAEAGFPLLGDPLPAIERAEDRGRFGALVGELGLRAPAWGTAATSAEARAVAERIGYPVLVRPHHVLGGRGMRVVRRPEELELDEPALVDEFLEGALELDVDVLCDGESSWVGGILEHVEPAGVHSGDSACVIPAPSVTAALEAEIRELSAAIAAGLGARGLLNLQLALHRGQLYVLEANPRASRTVPFLAKATGTPLVDHACRLLLGATLQELDLPSRATPTRAWAKEAVFPEERFANAADRGPEMRSTGEVMASGDTVSQAYGRVLRASGRGRRGGSIGLPLQAGGGPVPVLRPRGVQAARSSSRSV